MWLHSLSPWQMVQPLIVPLTGQTASGLSVTYDLSVGRWVGAGYWLLPISISDPQTQRTPTDWSNMLYSLRSMWKSKVHHPNVWSRLACASVESLHAASVVRLSWCRHPLRLSAVTVTPTYSSIYFIVPFFIIFCVCTSRCSLSRARWPKPSQPPLLCGSLCNRILAFPQLVKQLYFIDFS